MAEKSGFFNSSAGDRVYDATDFAAYFGNLVTNGIFYRNTDNLRAIANNGMSVTVQPGSAWINGYRYENTEPLSLTVATADGVNPRIDRVVLRWSVIESSINLDIKTGAPQSVPVPPELTRSSEVYELGLADIYVSRSVISITPADITDTRLNSSLCGTVNSLVTAVYE